MANKIKLAGTTNNTFDVGLDGNGNITAGNVTLSGNANISGNGVITNLAVGTELDTGNLVVNQNLSTTGGPGIRVAGNYVTGGSAGQFQTLSYSGLPGVENPLADNDYTFQIQTLAYTGPSGQYEPVPGYGYTGDFAIHKANTITSPVGFNYVGGYFQFVQFGNDGTNDNAYDYQLENGQLRIGGFSPTNGFGPAETNFTVTVQDGTGTQSSYKFGNDGNITLPTNTSFINYANGSPYSVATSNANYANFAGQVVDSSQSNITSLGSLTSLDMSGNITMNGHQISNSGTIAVSLPNNNNFTSFDATYNTHYGSATSFYRGNGTVGGSMNNIAVGDVIKNENYFVYADSGNTYLGVGQTYVDVAYNDGAGNVAIRTFMAAPTVDGVAGKNSVYTVGYENSFFNNIFANAITANLYNGNGSGLTNINGSNVVGPVSEAIAAERAIYLQSSPGTGKVEAYLDSVLISAGATSNVAIFTENGLSVTGNVSATHLAGEGGNISNVQVANISGLGNIATVNLTGSSSNVLYGNGTFAPISVTSVANANYANFAGTVLTNAQPNITSVGTLTSLAVTGNITSGNATLGNLTTSNFFSGNGSLLSSITAANVSGNVATATLAYTSNLTSNNSSNTFYMVFASGNGSQQLSIDNTGAVITYNPFQGNLTVNNVIGNVTGTAGSATTAGTVTTNAQPNITSVGTLTSLAVTGNVSAGNVNAPTFGAHNGTIGATTPNTASFTTVSASGQITSTLATGNAPFVVTSTTQVANLNVATAGTATTAGTVTTAAQPNITSVGTLTSVSVSGNANIGNIGTAGQLVSSIATGTAPFVVTSTTQVANLSVATAGSATTAGTVTTAAQPNITSTGTLTSLSVSGTATIGNLALTKFNETVVASANTSTSITPDLASGSIFAYTANNNFTFNGFANAVAGSSAVVKITQDGTGNRTMTSTMKFAGGSKTLSTAASSIDIISVYYDGSTYYATLSKGYA